MYISLYTPQLSHLEDHKKGSRDPIPTITCAPARYSWSNSQWHPCWEVSQDIWKYPPPENPLLTTAVTIASNFDSAGQNTK
jgi:hypothetical protein